MGYEIGGRADKFGNRYEYNWAITKLVEVIEEKLSYVILEAIGKDEEGVDIWVADQNGNLEGQQCKGRCGSDETWTYGTINSKGIWINWKNQLERNDKINVSLISPLAFTNLEDILIRANNNNGNANDFVEVQIETASQEIRRLFNNICKKMDINIKTNSGKDKALNYFQRMHYRQYPDSVAKDILLLKIERIFCGDAEKVYDAMLDLIINGNIYGEKITLPFLNSCLEKKQIKYRNLTQDTRIWPKIQNINDEFKKSYNTFSKGLIHRTVTENMWDKIRQGESIVIHGKAGAGKSGCSAEIIDLCEKSAIPYIAVKLDKHVPNKNTEIWANELGLPASISYCADSISKDRPAVILLDQLDALRWTQAHSRDSLSVCMRIINEVESLNRERECKISMVFVCRTYDFENDAAIKQLFEKESELKWNNIEIGELTDGTIKVVIGDEYDGYSKKIKKLLRIASNLFIWEKLDKSKNYSNIEATYQLVAEWWKQISENASRNSLNTMYLEQIKDIFVNYCENRGCISLPVSILKMPSDYKVFLISNGFLIQTGSVISISHQSILDCFLSEQMLKKYYDGMSVTEIIGVKEKQTPGRRYQVQIFLQQVFECSVEDFIEIGKQLIESENIRFNVKYVFVELLSQIKENIEYVWEYEKLLLNDSTWKIPIISTAVMGNISNIHNARDCGLLDSWMKDDSNLVIDIMRSISPYYDDIDIEFIRKYALEKGGNVNWWPCFCRDINEGSERYFELRLEFHRKFPNTVDRYIDFKSMFSVCEIRTIKMILLFIELDARRREKNISRYAEDLICEDTDIIVNDYKVVLNYLMSVLPDMKVDYRFSGWSCRYNHSHTLERVVMKILKLANHKFAKYEPDKFWDTNKMFMGSGNHLYNELLLDAFVYLPDEYADEIIKYLCSNLEKNAIEDTSGNGKKLLLASQVISHFSSVCSDTIYNNLEKKIISYSDSRCKEILKNRIEANRYGKAFGRCVYWKYWGDLQLCLIPSLDEKRRSREVNELFKVLSRNLDLGYKNRFDYKDDFPLCNVVSPVSGKQLKSKNWIDIITNSKIKTRNGRDRFENGMWIESSLSNYVSSFRQYISEESINVIQKDFIDTDNIYDSIYVDALFSGIVQNPKLDELANQEIETLIKKYGYDMQSHRAGSICKIIEKKQDIAWSEDILASLVDIALHHENSSINSSEDDERIKEYTVEDLEINALNCVRGQAIYAIGHLLWNSTTEVFEFFKDTLEELSYSDSLIIKYSLLRALWPSYNHNEEWAIDIIMKLFIDNYQLLGFYNCRSMLCRYYLEYKDGIDNTIMLGIKSSDERLVREYGRALAELHMLFDVYAEIIQIYQSSEKNVKKSILEMIILYVELPDYRDKAINILNTIIELENDDDNDFLWGKLFEKDLLKYPEDEVLIKKILMSKINRRVMEFFYDYLSRNNDIKQYSDIIIDMSENVIEKESIHHDSILNFDTIMSKLIIGLYDQVSSSNTAENRVIANRCLDVWDLMYERNLGIAREFSNQIMDM